MQTTLCNAGLGIYAVNPAFNLRLAAQAAFSVPDVANVRIACVEGTVWITLDNDPRDIVLEACGVFTTPEHRRAIVYAMKPSQITVAAMPSKTAKLQQLPRLILQP
ncbi:MAG: DUF2917 domain-containing protein [Polaromonas sp.]